MINANELRIGNFVNEKVLGNVKILEIHTKVVIVEAINLTVNKEKIAQQYTLSLSDIEPIKLTEKWFVNFGFIAIYHIFKMTFEEKIIAAECLKNGKPIPQRRISDNIDYYHFPFKQGKWVRKYLDTDNFSISINNFENWCTSVKYVHQLQNLYFALNVQELSVVANSSKPPVGGRCGQIRKTPKRFDLEKKMWRESYTLFNFLEFVVYKVMKGYPCTSYKIITKYKFYDRK